MTDELLNEDRRILSRCNETELITIAQKAGLGRLRRGLSIATLVDIVAGAISPSLEHLSGTYVSRQRLEATIKKNIEVMRSQLPGCTGRCTVYNCSDGRHSVCYSPNEDQLHP